MRRAEANFPSPYKVRQWLEKGLGIAKRQKISFMQAWGDYHGDIWPEPVTGYYRGVKRSGGVLISNTPNGKAFAQNPNSILRIDTTGEPIQLRPEEPKYYFDSDPCAQVYTWKGKTIY